MRNSFLRLVLLTAGILFLPAAIRAENRIVLPEGVFYHQFASQTNGAAAGWVNPSVLGRDRNIYVQYIGEYSAGHFGKSHGVAMAGDNVGIAYRKIDNFNGRKYKEYIFSAGLELVKGLYGGGSYRHIKEGPEGWPKRHFWNLAFLITKSPRYILAGTFSNLNRNVRDGQKTDIEHSYSLTYQTQPGRLSLSVEALLIGEEGIGDADFRFGAHYNIGQRLRVYASMDERNFFQLGLVIHLDDYLLGGQSRFDSDAGHLGTALYGAFTKQGRRSPENK